jgi:[protein-PII] uridylyltransferase
MTDYLRRLRSALGVLRRGQPDASVDERPVAAHPATPATPPVPAGENFAIAGGAVIVVDPAKAALDPASWMGALDAALMRNVPLSAELLAILHQHASRFSAEVLLPAASAPRLLALLGPRPGLSSRLDQLQRAGLLGSIFPTSRLAGRRDPTLRHPSDLHALAAIGSLEGLLSDPSLNGERFGTMLREVRAPGLLVVTLLLHDVGIPPRDADQPPREALAALDRLHLGPDARDMVEFLLRHKARMSSMAIRQDTADPGVISGFAVLFTTEEQLKMLCLITVAELGAKGPHMLTPWKAELLWRLFVDTYNHLTMNYGDEVIERNEAALAALQSNRPHDLSEGEVAGFLEGLPKRYLTLFEPESIYQHVRLSRDIRPDDVHFFLHRKSDVWELSVVTLDKPYLFSNLCGILSYFDLDILRGYALTSRTSLVLDVFQFTDRKGCLVRPSLDPLLSEAVAGRADITSLLEEKARGTIPPRAPGAPPVIYFDNDSSPRYTILELIAEDAPGLLHRISRILSRHGCVVDLVLISTEGTRAIDVFHTRKGSAKLTESDALALTEDLERMLNGAPEPHHTN